MIVWLETSTWAGLSIDAEHWFGVLRGGDRRIKLSHQLTSAEAAYCNKKQGVRTYRAGSVSEGFETLEALRTNAVAVFRQHFPKALLLIEQNNELYPGPVLFGPPEVQAAALALHDRMEAQYKGRREPQSWKEHDAILDEWDNLIKPFA